MVLVGVESKYVRDRHTSEAERGNLEKLTTLEQFVPATASEAEKFKDDTIFKSAAKAKFTKRVQKITAESHIRFQFDTPVRKGESLVYEVRFR